MSDKLKLRWHQVSLRTVMVVTTATAIGLGIRANQNVASFVIGSITLLAVLRAFAWSTERSRLREQAQVREFWRRFENQRDELRNGAAGSGKPSGVD